VFKVKLCGVCLNINYASIYRTNVSGLRIKGFSLDALSPNNFLMTAPEIEMNITGDWNTNRQFGGL